ncbi:MAG: hypothetical protein AAGG38_01390 [Planctomycetota bacterium]
MPLRTARRLIASAALCLPAASPAQPLIEHVPPDAVAYAGWAGTASLTEPYAGSTLRGVAELADPDRLTTAWRSVMPALQRAFDHPRLNALLPHIQNLWLPRVHGEVAAYFTAPPPPIDPTHRPPPGLVLLWSPDSGDDREALLSGLKHLVESAPSPAQLVVDGPVITLRINLPAVDPASPPAPATGPETEPETLANTPRFQTAWAGLDRPGPLALYLDTAALAPVLRERLLRGVEPVRSRQIEAILNALQLDRLGAAVATAGFDGRGWRTQAHLAAPAPRAGLGKLLEAPALTADALSLPPRTATWTTTFSLDPGMLMDLARDAAGAAGPETADRFEQALASASGALGLDLEQQLIRGLGTAWTAYLDPEAVGDSPLGITFESILRDPEGVDRGLRALQLLGNVAWSRRLADKPYQLLIHTQDYGPHTLHTLGVPLAAPTWAIVDGRLIAGLYPQSVLAAIQRRETPGSIQNRDPFAALVERIGTRRLTALTWTDLPRTASQNYPNLVALERAVTGSASAVSGRPMPPALPPLGQLRPYLEPADAIAWIDDDGWYFDGRTPFPAAELLGPGTALARGIEWGPPLPQIKDLLRELRKQLDQ